MQTLNRNAVALSALSSLAGIVSLAAGQTGVYSYIGALGGRGQEVVVPTVLTNAGVVYGENNYFSNRGNFRRGWMWTSASGMDPLSGTLDSGTSSGVYAATPDGRVIVGVLGINPGASGTNAVVFRRVNGGVNETLPLVAGMFYPQVTDISDDGTTTIGIVNGYGGGGSAVRWIGTNMAEVLPALAEVPSAQAIGVNGDGSVIVGWSGRGYPYDSTPVRWVNGQIESLGMPPGSQWAHATAVSADGSVIVGVAEFTGFIFKAFRWTASAGYEYLQDGQSGLAEAASISADGRMISGRIWDKSVVWRDGVPYRVLDDILPSGSVVAPLPTLAGRAIMSRGGEWIGASERLSEAPGDAEYHAWAVRAPSWFTCLSPMVTGGSADPRVCQGGEAALSIRASGGNLSYQWTIEMPAGSGQFVDLSDGALNESGLMLQATGATTSTLVLSQVRTAPFGPVIRVAARVMSGCNGTTVVAPALTLRACAADFNCDDMVDFFDYLDFVAAFSSEGLAADFNADGNVDFFDYLDFVAAFSAGC